MEPIFDFNHLIDTLVHYFRENPNVNGSLQAELNDSDSEAIKVVVSISATDEAVEVREFIHERKHHDPVQVSDRVFTIEADVTTPRSAVYPRKNTDS